MMVAIVRIDVGGEGERAVDFSARTFTRLFRLRFHSILFRCNTHTHPFARSFARSFVRSIDQWKPSLFKRSFTRFATMLSKVFILAKTNEAYGRCSAE